MARIPLSPKRNGYGGNDPAKRRKADAHNDMADRVIDHIHRSILDDPAEHQSYEYATLARELGLSFEDVAGSVIGGGDNAVSIDVGEKDRAEIKRFRRALGEVIREERDKK